MTAARDATRTCAQCGETKPVALYYRMGRTYSSRCRSCHSESRVKEMIGLTFGRLTVLEDAGPHPSNRGRVYVCRCACGKLVRVEGAKLRSGHTTSCGCYAAEAAAERARGRTPAAAVAVPPAPASETRIRLPVVAGFVRGLAKRHDDCARYEACLRAYTGPTQAQCPVGARGDLGCYRPTARRVDDYAGWRGAVDA